MINQNDEKNNTFVKTECDFQHAIQELGIAGLLRKSNIFKEKGHSAFSVFQTLLLMVFRGCSLYEFLRGKKSESAYDDNTYYRFLDSIRFNWQRFLLLLSAKVISYMDTLTRSIPVGFSMLASAKEDKRINASKSEIDKRSRGFKCRMEAIMQKPQAAIMLIRNALKHGIHADYVLMDTWFTNEPLIKEILSKCHIFYVLNFPRT